MHLDDVLVDGKDDNDFISYLHKVFIRQHRYNVTLNITIEYVGHTLRDTVGTPSLIKLRWFFYNIRPRE
jgi:hypothetical protein